MNVNALLLRARPPLFLLVDYFDFKYIHDAVAEEGQLAGDVGANDEERIKMLAFMLEVPQEFIRNLLPREIRLVLSPSKAERRPRLVIPEQSSKALLESLPAV